MKQVFLFALLGFAAGQVYMSEKQFDDVNVVLDQYLPTADVGTLVNLVFTDCTDGCNGCVASTTLDVFQPVADQLEQIWQSPAVGGAAVLSRSDFWVLAANKAIVSRAVNPRQPPTDDILALVYNFRNGRIQTDCSTLANPVPGCRFNAARPWETCTAEAHVPQVGGWTEWVATANALNLNFDSLTAMMGAHVLGTKHSVANGGDGYTGPWTEGMKTFDNSYYTWMIGPMWESQADWTLRDEGNAGTPFKRFSWVDDKNGVTSMLTSDIAMSIDVEVDATGRPTCRNQNGVTTPVQDGSKLIASCYSFNQYTRHGTLESYRDDWQYWMNDFASAWNYYVERNHNTLSYINNDNWYDFTFHGIIDIFNNFNNNNNNDNNNNNGLGNLGGNHIDADGGLHSNLGIFG